jgi:hypothetical protein
VPLLEHRHHRHHGFHKARYLGRLPAEAPFTLEDSQAKHACGVIVGQLHPLYAYERLQRRAQLEDLSAYPFRLIHHIRLLGLEQLPDLVSDWAHNKPKARLLGVPSRSIIAAMSRSRCVYPTCRHHMEYQ